ncbi:PREDICTED: butyrophilin subfamily 2 member A1-like [Poecilia mexicana]|uniref:butyrophilin subfamily 2 member A1-like n=1 Tax=Poecilia mexicana TaxID=48701 RepID=UPI00072E1047|nr:PREDICTED: butyrophilin subfamily 2 member A1-like [Poecilia mexicana]
MATRLCLLLALCIVLSGCEAAEPLCSVRSSPADPVNITAEPGQNVTLTCRAAGNGIVTAVRLTRDDLKPRYVLLYRDEQIDEEQQHPQYKNRTKLQSLISTDGEINLTLDSVTEKDSGKYECRVRTEIKSNTRRKRAALESTFIHLRVDPGRGRIGLVAGLVVVALAVLAVSIWKMSIWKKMKTPSPPPLHRDKAVEPLQV